MTIDFEIVNQRGLKKMKNSRGEIIGKYLDEIFLNAYEDKILERFKKTQKY